MAEPRDGSSRFCSQGNQSPVLTAFMGQSKSYGQELSELSEMLPGVGEKPCDRVKARNILCKWNSIQP